jgi:hypothetical protein
MIMRKKFALQKGEDKRLEISWKARWKSVAVKLDDQEVGTIPGKAEMLEGRDFDLPDGSRLRVQLKKITVGPPTLWLYRNDKPLPGSNADPQKRLAVAYRSIFFIAAVSLLFGAIFAISEVKAFQDGGYGVFVLIYGAVFLVLGLLVRKGSVPALAIAMIILLADTVYTSYVFIELIDTNDAGRAAWGIFLRVTLLFWMWPGFAAIRELKERDAN